MGMNLDCPSGAGVLGVPDHHSSPWVACPIYDRRTELKQLPQSGLDSIGSLHQSDIGQVLRFVTYLR